MAAYSSEIDKPFGSMAKLPPCYARELLKGDLSMDARAIFRSLRVGSLRTVFYSRSLAFRILFASVSVFSCRVFFPLFGELLLSTPLWSVLVTVYCPRNKEGAFS